MTANTVARFVEALNSGDLEALAEYDRAIELDR